MHTNSYNPQRQLLLVKRQLTVFQQPLLTVVKFGLIALLTPVIIRAFIEPDDLGGLQGYFLFAYLFGGLLITSHVFKELHSPHRSYFFLTLPASALEKLIGAWLLTVPLYTLVYIVASFIVFFTGHLIAGEAFAFASFFEGFGETVLAYLIIQPIFLWGAVYFKKSNFLKTTGAILAFCICLGLYSGGLIFALYEPAGPTIVESSSVTATAEENQTYIYIDGQKVPITQEDDPELVKIFNNIIEPTLEFLFFVVFGPYMLLLTYFTLKERQL